MKLLNIISCLLILLSAGCSNIELPEPGKDAFYKLYGNGTIQEAVAMEFAGNGDVYIIGNQFVRNQDSSALVLIRTNAEGNQLWSRRFYGKGHSSSKSLLLLPTGELLILASTRGADRPESRPVLYRLNEKGDLLNEHIFSGEEDTSSFGLVPEDMVLTENGDVFIVGNRRGTSGTSEKSFIKKINPVTGEILDEREFSNAGMTEVKRVFRHGGNLLLAGNTSLESDDARRQNIFLALFSPHLIEARHAVIGSPASDSFRKAFVNSRSELVIVAAEKDESTGLSKGVFNVLDINSLEVKNNSYLNLSENELPEAIAEDEEGNYMVAVNSIGDRGRTNMLLNKIDPFGTPVWEVAREIGGAGSDKIAQVKIRDQFVYLLTTIDMQNENTLISLSRIRF